jgi:hypothetical protein
VQRHDLPAREWPSAIIRKDFSKKNGGLDMASPP